MAISKPSTSKPSNDKARQKNNVELLKSEVATFASSLGLSSSSLPSSSGFNDADFRKSGALKKPKSSKQRTKLDKTLNGDENESAPKVQFHKSSEKGRNFKNKDDKSHKNEKKSQFDKKPKKNPVPKPPVLSLDDNNKSNSSTRAFDKYKNLPKLPLVKASALGAWHEDAMEFEKKVLGEGKSKLELKMAVEEWKGVVEKKKELGERLMWQYSQDYEQSRGQSGDIKMVVTTQRSGTAADKVSAFSVLVGDNPIANLRSLDALIGK